MRPRDWAKERAAQAEQDYLPGSALQRVPYQGRDKKRPHRWYGLSLGWPWSPRGIDMEQDVWRTIAVIVEVIILAGVFWALLNGVRLIVLDLGMGEDYRKMMTVAFGIMEAVLVVWLISHLAIFYPEALPG